MAQYRSVGRVSRLAGSSPKDFNFESFANKNEANYQIWWNHKSIYAWFRSIPEDTLWNCMICSLALAGVLMVATDIHLAFYGIEEYVYDMIYAVHFVAMLYQYKKLEDIQSTWWKKLGFVVDILSYLHYVVYFVYNCTASYVIRLTCYYMRLHRPFRYLWALNDSNLKGSVIGTTLKYLYIFAVVRVSFALLYVVSFDVTVDSNSPTETDSENLQGKEDCIINLKKTPAGRFAFDFYIINKMFLPIGTDAVPGNDIERLVMLTIMLSGCFMVSGAAVASLSLVISLYMRPEETFRSRFRLIMKEMTNSKVPPQLCHKVESFYQMYWHKQKAVSVTYLLPLFPPTLPASIHTDIYFEAQQKSPILRDLSYQFLWEIAKKMSTIHFIPGDTIIQRNATMSSIIYITYGDIEMLTAEDNETPILRFTRGSIISPCGGCVALACGKALVEVRAATFCTAHVLTATNLWKVAAKHGKQNGQTFIMKSAFEELIERVKRNYRSRDYIHPVKFKSSIQQFKRNLLALKEAKDEDGKPLLARNDFFLQVAGSYIMRNRADSSLTEESDAICLRPTFPCILQPESSLLFAWHAVVSVLICVVTVTHPYKLVFKKEVDLEFRLFDYTVTGVFVLDLLVHLSTGANVEEGVPITFAQTSSQQVQSPWFILDTLGTLPIFELMGHGHFAGLNKLLRLPKVFRVLRAMEEVCVYHSTLIRFFSYCLMLMLVCYLLGSLKQAYECFVEDLCLVANFTHAPHWSKTSEDWEPVEDQLAFSLYYAISMVTFTSHKTIPLMQSTQTFVLFTVATIEFCAILRIFIEAVYSATIMVTTAMRDEYDACIENVKNFLIRNQMDPMLRQRFITYLQLCWFTDKAYSITHQKRSILFDLPLHVHEDIMARQRNKYILRLPFMRYLNAQELKKVSVHASLFYTSPNEILLNTGDVSNEIYIIKQGFCEVFDPNSRKVIALISEKKYFGVLECLMRFPAYYTVRAVTHVQVFSISTKYLSDLIHVPKIRDAIQHIKALPEFKYVQVRREPFLVYKPPPPPGHRQTFPLPRKHIPDTEFLKPFYSLGHLSILRYMFPRFTLRPDGPYLVRYEWFRGACALTNAMLCPSYTYLVLQWPWLYYCALFFDISAYFDIIQRMLVGYFNEKGILVYHPASTAAHYIKGAFVVDLIACLPLENLETPHLERPGEPRLDKFLSLEVQQFLMLNRLLQLYRITNALEFFRNYIHRRDVLLVIKAIPLIMVVINLVTCLMVMHSVDIYDSVSAGQPWLILPLEGDGGEWIRRFGNIFAFNVTETPFNLHLAVYFWVVYETITTGYNVFNPSSLEQIYILLIGMFVCAMIITYFSVLVISIRAKVNHMLATFQDNMKDIVTFMKREKLHKDLHADVLAYYEYNWDKMGGLNYRQVLKLCDQITLRTDAILHIYGHTFAKCPILQHCDTSLLRVLGRAVHNMYFQKDTAIVETDDVISDLYFIDYGSVDRMTIHEAQKTIVKLPKGSVFGNLDFSRTYRCPSTMVATSNVQLLKIDAVAFQGIITDFPTVRVLMYKYRPNNENYIIGSEGSGTLVVSTEVSASRHNFYLSEISNTIGIFRFVHENSRVSQMFLIATSLLCIYGDIYNAGFCTTCIGFVLILYVLDLSFCVKILVNLMMPFIVEEGEARDSLFDFRKRYIRHEFKYDVVSILPLELFCFFSDHNRWKLFAVLRLNRTFRIVTVYKCLQRQQQHLSSSLVLGTVSAVCVWFSLFLHVSACVWYTIGVIEDHRQPNSSWMHSKGMQANCSPCDDKYICSLYFVLTTFTHNGDAVVLPRKHSEVIFTTILEIVSSLIFMVYVGEFSNIFQFLSFRSFGFYSKYLELQEFLKNNRVSNNLVRIVSRYSLHLWRECRGVQMPYFLETAPPCFKLKIMSAAFLHHFTKNPVFRGCEPAFLRQLVGCLTWYTYCAGIFVVKADEITDSMYLIHKGRVQQIDDDMDDDIVQRQIFIPGEYFGMTQGLKRNTPYEYSYRAITKSQVLTLHLDAWEYLLEHFPKSRFVIYRHNPGRPFSKPPKSQEYKASLYRKGEEQLKSMPVTDTTALGPDGEDEPRRTHSRMSTYAPQAFSKDEIRQDGSSEQLLHHISEYSLQKTLHKDKSDDSGSNETLSRRKTFLEKITESARKFVKGDNQEEEDKDKPEEELISGDMFLLEDEEKDFLQFEEQMEATRALLHDFEDNDKSTHQFIVSEFADKKEDNEDVSLKPAAPSLVHRNIETSNDSQEEVKTMEKEKDVPRRRTPTLSFLPELTLRDTEGEIPPFHRAKRSIHPGLKVKKDTEDDDEATSSRKAPTLSFVPGLIQKEDKDATTSRIGPMASIIRPRFNARDDKKQDSVPVNLNLKIDVDEDVKDDTKKNISKLTAATVKEIDETKIEKVYKLSQLTAEDEFKDNDHSIEMNELRPMTLEESDKVKWENLSVNIKEQSIGGSDEIIKEMEKLKSIETDDTKMVELFVSPTEEELSEEINKTHSQEMQHHDSAVDDDVKMQKLVLNTGEPSTAFKSDPSKYEHELSPEINQHRPRGSNLNANESLIGEAPGKHMEEHLDETQNKEIEKREDTDTPAADISDAPSSLRTSRRITHVRYQAEDVEDEENPDRKSEQKDKS